MSIEPLYPRLGRRIRTARLCVALTQEELARKLGWTRAHLANIETGRRRVHAHEVLVLATVLRLNVVELLGVMT